MLRGFETLMHVVYIQIAVCTFSFNGTDGPPSLDREGLGEGGKP